MKSVFEKPWFKWVAMGSTSFLLLALLGGFALTEYLKIRAVQKEREAAKRAIIEYQDKFRNILMRIRQNLELEHYLAAYKNLEFLPGRRPNDSQMLEEYLDVLRKIGRGLLENNFLTESENVFDTIREIDPEFEGAGTALSQIESKRRLDGARFFLGQAQKMIDEKRYRDALGDLQKAETELKSVEILKFDDVEKEYSEHRRMLQIAKYWVHLEDAEKAIRDAWHQLKLSDFSKARTAITKATLLTGRASFLRPGTPEVERLRRALVDVDAEFAFLFPNAIPIWNEFKETDQKNENFFLLTGYHFEPLDGEGKVKISFSYRRQPSERYFVIRYRIFFANGKDFFNGHYLRPPQGGMNSDKELSISYIQDLPEKYKNLKVRRIELFVFNEQDRLIAKLNRAFRVSDT